jgi:hypothetical protein
MPGLFFYHIIAVEKTDLFLNFVTGKNSSDVAGIVST